MKKQNKLSKSEMFFKSIGAIYDALFDDKDNAIKFYTNEINQEYFEKHFILSSLVGSAIHSKITFLIIVCSAIFNLCFIIYALTALWEEFWFLADAVSEEL